MMMPGGWGFGGMGGLGGGGGHGFPTMRRFEEQYHCYSVAYADKSQLEVRPNFACCLAYKWCGGIQHPLPHTYFFSYAL